MLWHVSDPDWCDNADVGVVCRCPLSQRPHRVTTLATSLPRPRPPRRQPLVLATSMHSRGRVRLCSSANALCIRTVVSCVVLLWTLVFYVCCGGVASCEGAAQCAGVVRSMSPLCRCSSVPMWVTGCPTRDVRYGTLCNVQCDSTVLFNVSICG